MDNDTLFSSSYKVTLWLLLPSWFYPFSNISFSLSVLQITKSVMIEIYEKAEN